jgi:metal-responsive CopG/Arc/MetJ family transcriptional regulator
MPTKLLVKRCLGICLDAELVEEIDRRKGLVKRSTFLNHLLRKLILLSDVEKAEK